MTTIQTKITEEQTKLAELRKEKTKIEQEALKAKKDVERKIQIAKKDAEREALKAKRETEREEARIQKGFPPDPNADTPTGRAERARLLGILAWCNKGLADLNAERKQRGWDVPIPPYGLVSDLEAEAEKLQKSQLSPSRQ